MEGDGILILTDNYFPGWRVEVDGEPALLYRSLADRRKAILQTLGDRGLLSDKLRDANNACRDKIELEDLYLPLKRRERTKATAAVDRGLGPLADLINDLVVSESSTIRMVFIKIPSLVRLRNCCNENDEHSEDLG